MSALKKKKKDPDEIVLGKIVLVDAGKELSVRL